MFEFIKKLLRGSQPDIDQERAPLVSKEMASPDSGRGSMEPIVLSAEKRYAYCQIHHVSPVTNIIDTIRTYRCSISDIETNDRLINFARTKGYVESKWELAVESYQVEVIEAVNKENGETKKIDIPRDYYRRGDWVIALAKKHGYTAEAWDFKIAENTFTYVTAKNIWQATRAHQFIEEHKSKSREISALFYGQR